MNKSDMIIKDSLKKNMKKIDDELFTKRIVDKHLAKRKNSVPMPFMNFASLIFGLSLVVLSIGIVILLQTEKLVIPNFDVSKEHGIILLSLSLLFLIYKWAEEVLFLKLYKR